MPTAHVRLGLPLQGINREGPMRLPVPQMNQWYAHDISALRFDTSRRLRQFPPSASYADTVNAERVTGMRTIRWGDGTTDVVRHSATDFHELFNGSWLSRRAVAHTGTGDSSYWGGAVCAGNLGKGFYVYSAREISNALPNKVFAWSGASGAAVGIAGADAARHVAAYADRTMLFNQTVAGSVRARRVQWSVPGTTTMTGTGSGSREFGEFDSEITGAAVIRSNLFVYSNKSIIGGAETYDPRAPVTFSPVTTQGIGSIADNGLLSYNDQHAFLSFEGFRGFNGQQIIPIGSAIDDYIMTNINRGALATICGFVKPEWHIAAWALPMQGSSTPNELWVFDYARNAWLRAPLTGTNALYPVAPTAFTVVEQSSGLQWDDPFFIDPPNATTNQWSDAGLATQRWIDFAGTASAPSVVSGHSDGSTRSLDENANGGALSFHIDTPDFSFEGSALLERDLTSGQSQVGYDDLVTLDSVEIHYSTISGAGTVYLLVSVDGGETYVAFGVGTGGAVSLPAGTGEAVRRVRVFGRVSGRTLRLRITNINPLTGSTSTAAVRLEDLYLTARRSGAARAA